MQSPGRRKNKVSNFSNYLISCNDRCLKTSINGWPWITDDFIEQSASASKEINLSKAESQENVRMTIISQLEEHLHGYKV